MRIPASLTIMHPCILVQTEPRQCAPYPAQSHRCHMGTPLPLSVVNCYAQMNGPADDRRGDQSLTARD